MLAQHKTHSPIGNQLLANLPNDELEAIRPHLEYITLLRSQPLINSNELIPHVYFPVNALASLVIVLEDGATIEAGAVGREGMVGVSILLDANTTPMQTLVQIPGEAIRVKAEIIKRAFDRKGELRNRLNRYIHTLFIIASQSAACNRHHNIEKRLCRWLLMSSDGVGGDEIALTQEYLAVMLGVRRAGVTEVAIQLQNEGAIRYRRGSVKIIDRIKLESIACECYRMVKNEYDRLFVV